MGLRLPLLTVVASTHLAQSPPQTHLLRNGETEAERLGAHRGLNSARAVRPHASNPLVVAPGHSPRKPVAASSDLINDGGLDEILKTPLVYSANSLFMSI